MLCAITALFSASGDSEFCALAWSLGGHHAVASQTEKRSRSPQNLATLFFARPDAPVRAFPTARPWAESPPKD